MPVWGWTNYNGTSVLLWIPDKSLQSIPTKRYIRRVFPKLSKASQNSPTNPNTLKQKDVKNQFTQFPYKHQCQA